MDVSKAQEAVDYIEEKLKTNFKMLKVKDIDKIYKTDENQSSEVTEILVSVTVARNIQTGYRSRNQHLVSIKIISLLDGYFPPFPFFRGLQGLPLSTKIR